MDEREFRASDAGEDPTPDNLTPQDSTPFEVADDDWAPAFSLPAWVDEAIARSQQSGPLQTDPPTEPAPETPAFLDSPDIVFSADDFRLERADAWVPVTDPPTLETVPMIETHAPMLETYEELLGSADAATAEADEQMLRPADVVPLEADEEMLRPADVVPLEAGPTAWVAVEPPAALESPAETWPNGGNEGDEASGPDWVAAGQASDEMQTARAWLPADKAGDEVPTSPPAPTTRRRLEGSRPVDAPSRPLLGDGAALPSFLPDRWQELPRGGLGTTRARPVVPLVLLAVALILAGIAAALFLATQFGITGSPDAISTGATGETEAPPTAEEPSDSPAQVPTFAADSAGAADQAQDLDEHVGTEPGAAVNPTLATDESPAANRPAAGGDRYGISVGIFRSEERAIVERARLAASTGLVPKTVMLNEGGEFLYRLVLGSFDSYEGADSTAITLVKRGVVPDAFVVPLGGAKSTPR